MSGNSALAGTGTASMLPGGGSASGPTRWVVAVMTALAMLGVAAAIALAPAAAALSGQIAGRATIQIVEPDTIARREAVGAIRLALTDAPYIGTMRTVPEAELVGMASQWLGDGVRDAGLPLPALIDVDLVGGNNQAALQRLESEVRAVAPQARVIAHADWLGPVARFLSVAGWFAAGVALLLVAAAAAVAVVAARGALMAQRPLIDILHLVGATDVQIARLFQRQTLRDAAVGATVGAVLALIIGGLAGWQLQTIAWGLVVAPRFGLYLWALLVPALVVAIAVYSARRAVLAALRAMP